ncbi:FecR family protein [Brucellaceae bacterium C25G]
MSSNEITECANKEALHWLIALQEDPDDADILAQFNAWLKNSADNERAWTDAQRVWNTLGDAQTSTIQKNNFSKSDQSHQHGKKQRRLAKAFYSVAALSVVCFVLFLQPVISIWLSADWSTGKAETRNIYLDDGSIVHLGADSALKIDFDTGFRRVRLLAGEAYFEVEPDKNRPFQVTAGNIDATVLGTAFDVKIVSEGVAVAVNHGRVAVDHSDDDQNIGAPLEAGDWVRIDTSGQVERGNDAPELVGSWRNGMLVVKNQSISDVIDEIRRQYKGKILLADNDLGMMRVTGVYDLNSPIEALSALVQAHGAHIRQISPWLTVVSKF